MARNWIKGVAEEAPGQFAEKAKAAGKSTAQFASEHAHLPGAVGTQARVVKTLMGMPHREKGRSETSKIRSRYGEG